MQKKIEFLLNAIRILEISIINENELDNKYGEVHMPTRIKCSESNSDQCRQSDARHFFS